MTKPTISPYGSWKSSLTSDLIVSEVIELSDIALDGESIYWIERRPAERGRCVVVKRSPEGKITDITPPPYNVRTRVHEYGGGSFVVADGKVYFSNFTGQRLYCQDSRNPPQPITPEIDRRYADSIVDVRRGHIICVCEDFTSDKAEPSNTLIRINLDGSKESETLVSGNDFYSSPRLSPDGSSLAWLTWNHPNMPWHGTELWVAKLNEDGSINKAEKVAGGADESIFQPEWSPDNVIHFVSDRTGWWNLYRFKNHCVEPLARMEAEFGMPQWVFGMSTYAFESEHRIICTYTQNGRWRLATLNTGSGKIEEIKTRFTEISSLRAGTGRALFLAGSPDEPTSIVSINLDSQEIEVLRQSSKISIDSGYLSLPEPVEFPTSNKQKAHAFLYAPKNRDYVGAPGERPPLLVISHGGPTASTSGNLNLKIQYWTSRGFAVLDVNYRGSTGYGRAYRDCLDGEWGVVDVDDCVNGALYLVKQGEVDENRLAIRGSSAGGYTTLCALTFHNVFKAGASYYGVSDLESLVRDTHKFEAHYLDRLSGPYPEAIDRYKKRSPINHVDKLSCPVIFLQGLEDKIVPPNQAKMMVEALKRKGVPVAYITFPGEQHGFRSADTIKRALDAELSFYSQVFGFSVAGPIEPVPIVNQKEK